MSETTNIVTATFSEGCTSVTVDTPLYQYDYGQILKFEGLDLPDAYEVHFSNTSSASGTAKTQIGTAEDGVNIPDEYLQTGKYLYAYIYLHAGEDDGETVYTVIIPVRKRPAIDPTPVTPQEQSVITQAIAALNTAVQQTAEDVETTTANVNASEQNALDSEAWAVGERDGVPVTSTDETFQNNSKYYAGVAEQAAAESGWVQFYIDENGYLHYVKTSNVNLRFYIQNGDLYVTEGA
jgi:hypothetical protein